MARWKFWKFQDMHVLDWHKARSDQEKIVSVMFRRQTDGMVSPATLLIGTQPNLISLDETLDLLTTAVKILEADRAVFASIRSNIVVYAEVPEINSNIYGWVADLAKAEEEAHRYREREIAMRSIIGNCLRRHN